jgi:hypothetical protein
LRSVPVEVLLSTTSAPAEPVISTDGRQLASACGTLSSVLRNPARVDSKVGLFKYALASASSIVCEDAGAA